MKVEFLKSKLIEYSNINIEYEWKINKKKIVKCEGEIKLRSKFTG